jgi:prevent-host-death family protein
VTWLTDVVVGDLFSSDSCKEDRTLEWYTCDMRKAPQGEHSVTVGVRELRDHLSSHLERVKAGGELVVTERGRPIARVVSASAGTRLERLIAVGVVTPPSRPRRPSSTWGTLPKDVGLVDAVLEQRR